jgi:alkylation response protein AidB-like acyl-CoA dehydrogenase
VEFEPSEEQALIAKTARAFAERELAPRAAARDASGEFPEREMRALGELGLTGVLVPAAYGGAEAGAVALALVVREIARADASVAITLSVTNMVAETIARFGSEEAKRAYLPPVCSGEGVAAAFALSEPQAGSDPAALRTTFERTAGGGYRISGGKLWTTSGDRASVILVVARAAPDAGGEGGEGGEGGDRRFTAFVVERGARGLEPGRHEQKMGQHGSSTVALTFDGVEVPEHARLGGEGDGLRVAFAALGGGRIGVASLAVGVGGAALEAARRYARERRQFGAPIGEFQAVKLMLADSATALDAAWLLVLAAAWRKERGLPFVREAAEAKLFASERAVEVCDRAIQIHGGYGYSREFPVERHFRDVRVTTIYEGTSQIQRLVIARDLLAAAATSATI